MINIAICDDEQEFLDLIRGELFKAAEKLQITIETCPYTDGNRLVESFCNSEGKYDVVFLDIDMPDVSGLEVAKKLRMTEPEIILIFVSAHEQYVFDSIEYNPFRYIRKDRIEKELFLALKAANTRLEVEKVRYIVVKTEFSEVRLKHSDIMYFETATRKVGIHLKNGEVLEVRKTIKELYKELNDEHFIKTHSGCAVNVRYIERFSSYDVTLDNGEQLIVSRTRIKDVKKAIMNYWGG
ncbi:MAG: LytTR family DNA-binding domain-containing protein [Lachnospiraceae bacterium]|nr:LytTR family DNA-binding domain-containing protein [Lachnospiraceae bacterium]